jgi:hypothetical protein
LTVRKPIIGVMGGGQVEQAACELAERLGSLIAQRGWILLNGGRNAGIMAASARGAHQAGGLVIGILPGSDDSAAAPDLDVAVVTGLGDARNVINILSSDIVIACRGGAGTLSEIGLAIKNRRPLILLDRPQAMEFEQHIRTGHAHVAHTPEEAVALAAELLDKQGRNHS